MAIMRHDFIEFGKKHLLINDTGCYLDQYHRSLLFALGNIGFAVEVPT